MLCNQSERGSEDVYVVKFCRFMAHQVLLLRYIHPFGI